MKKFLLLFILFTCTKVFAQQDVCFVTSVCGKVEKANGDLIKLRDTVYYSSLRVLKISPKGFATIFHPKYGSIKVDSSYIKVMNANPNKVIKPEEESHLLEGLRELFRVKASQVKLSSRSVSCACEVLDDCIKTDPGINEKLLVIDSLVLPAESPEADTKINYVLQWKHQNTVYNNRLTINNNKVIITSADLMFNNVEYDENENPVKLGVVKIKGTARSISLLAMLQLHFTTSGELKNYYNSLHAVMPGNTEKEIFERFCQEVYIFYGKPDLCALKTIANYTE